MKAPDGAPPEVLSAERVRLVLVERLRAQDTGRESSCEVTGPLYTRQNSSIFLARCAAFPTAAAVKICIDAHTSVPDGRSARLEYEGLDRVYEAMRAASEYSVPRPYLLDEPNGLISREWIQGASMTELLFSLRCSATCAEGLVVKAARWLRCFHDAGRLGPRPMDTDVALTRVAELAKTALARDKGFSTALRCVDRTAHKLLGLQMEASWIHGDFKTDNLIVAGSRTLGLDVHQRMENVVLYDLGPFLNNLRLNLWRHTAWRWSHAYDRIASAFLTAYRVPREHRTMTALNWVRLLSMLSIWVTVAGRHPSGLSALAVHNVFRAAAAGIVSEIEAEGR